MVTESVNTRSGNAENWIHWLTDTLVSPKHDKQWFQEKTYTWLNGLMRQGQSITDISDLLICFTADLPEQKKLKKNFPLFYNQVLSRRVTEISEIAKSRRKILTEMTKGSDCFRKIMEVWKLHFHQLVPSPLSSHKSDYSRHATWMKALFEINEKSYKLLRDKWGKEHISRPNLWKALRDQGLPV